MRWRAMRSSAMLLLLSAPMAAAAFDVPANDGFVTDQAGVLSDDEERDLEGALARYREETSNEIAILLVATLGGEDISDVGVSVGRSWGVGSQQKSNGILLLAALEERAVTIQVGYGLEGAVPDIVAKGIIDIDIVPRFRDGAYGEGLAAAVESLQKHIGGEYTPDRYASGEGSGGLLIFLAVVALQIFGAIFARTKSWWQGGVVGGIAGLALTYLFFWWWSVPLLAAAGLLFDYLVSRVGPRGRGRGGFYGGGGWGGGRGGGGFGGFSGGSFGGGGAHGRW